jgi:hypothetical protein
LPQDEFEENKKEKENEFKKGLIEQIEKCNKRVNKELRKNIITPNDVKFFFTDCGNKKNKFDRTKIEINNLINWSKGLRPFFLNGIVSNIHVDGTTVPKKIGKIKIPFEKDEKKIIKSLK